MRRPLPPVPSAGDVQETRQAAAQQFVWGMRAGAADFAAAGAALSAIVAEVVPPARHRRSRCRTVLRYADGSQCDTTFLGPAGAPTLAAREWLAAEIRRYLAAGQQREASWLVADAAAPGGRAVDVCAWSAAG